nr:MAG TPA: hypothetical protein [Caudoviricetes sp.]
MYQIFSTVGLRFRRRAYRPGIRGIAAYWDRPGLSDGSVPS